MAERSINTPVGTLTLTEEAGAINALEWRAGARDETPLLDRAAAQLDAYFAGRLTAFDLPLTPRGSTLVQRVCAEMQAIPLGETRSYGDLARKLGVPAQAIGQACGANPIPVIIPCHRVLGANGLGGFSGAGGVETKVWLLRHEGAAGLLI
ncbi:methylated-DNA--[protein]-cysteine S-methyltransferase [Primorskyibacter aestuariivivens]|uniref:methylated-DNA--[protein]-cysteine S-methyltransferase n=1 Tax=Primorskyibacter aestuariivivens TaxID=1888912 RepID=UPI0022FFECE4|nr:methylated-DNA--[protein]-cysteine S-methyltransferase [Primorskyibacter aestuariivivens]MDA7427221.1 methylated-DNA--[protein]-cysteine S-methyltransferase [Primorskyibacter aestuariivivens]